MQEFYGSRVKIKTYRCDTSRRRGRQQGVGVRAVHGPSRLGGHGGGPLGQGRAPRTPLPRVLVPLVAKHAQFGIVAQYRRGGQPGSVEPGGKGGGEAVGGNGGALDAAPTTDLQARKKKKNRIAC